QTGIYAQAFRLLDASNMIAYLFAVLLLPMFSRMLKLKEDVRPLVQMASRLILIPAFSLAVVCWYFGSNLMDLLYDAHVEESGQILSILMFSLIPMAGAYIVGTLLTANGSLKELNTIALISVTLSFILNFMLIPKLGAYGAALACLATQLTAFLAQVLVAFRLFKLRVNQQSLLLIAPIVLVVATGYLVTDLGWILGSILTLVIGGGLTLISLIPNLSILKKLGNKSA
ncbi:MAG: polysaccharide biosynthesis C-terminal domain-containing protein, partial [Flavobacteriales bacterium]